MGRNKGIIDLIKQLLLIKRFRFPYTVSVWGGGGGGWKLKLYYDL